MFGDEDMGDVGVPFVPGAEIEEGGVRVDGDCGDFGGGVEGEEASCWDCGGWAGATTLVVRWRMVCCLRNY